MGAKTKAEGLTIWRAQRLVALFNEEARAGLQRWAAMAAALQKDTGAPTLKDWQEAVEVAERYIKADVAGLCKELKNPAKKKLMDMIR